MLHEKNKIPQLLKFIFTKKRYCNLCLFFILMTHNLFQNYSDDLKGSVNSVQVERSVVSPRPNC